MQRYRRQWDRPERTKFLRYSPLPPLIVWTWSLTSPGFTIGSIRASPTEPRHNKRQKASAQAAFSRKIRPMVGTPIDKLGRIFVEGKGLINNADAG